MEARDIIDFWFNDLTYKDWFNKDDDLDQTIADRFKELHQQASQAELFTWRATLLGRLAEIILLDQFSRNLYRGQARAFSQDGMALVLAQEAIAYHDLSVLSPDQKAFIYMPLMHSESIAIHERALELFAQPGLERYLKYEQAHRDIILQFGRYPHRNQALGRISTPSEIEFMAQHPGF